MKLKEKKQIAKTLLLNAIEASDIMARLGDDYCADIMQDRFDYIVGQVELTPDQVDKIAREIDPELEFLYDCDGE